MFPYGFGLTYKSNFQLEKIQIDDVVSNFDLINIFLGTASIPAREFVVLNKDPQFVLKDNYSSNDQSIRITRFDYQRQDDAKNIIFSENKLLKTFGISAELPINLTDMNSPFYEITLRVNTTSNPSLYFSVGCGDDCVSSIALDTKSMTNWSTINVPISCLEKDGLDKSKIQIRALFSSKEAINFDINSIIIRDGSATGSMLSC